MYALRLTLTLLTQPVREAANNKHWPWSFFKRRWGCPPHSSQESNRIFWQINSPHNEIKYLPPLRPCCALRAKLCADVPKNRSNQNKNPNKMDQTEQKSLTSAKSYFPKTALYKLLEATSFHSLCIITMILFILSRNDQKRQICNHNLVQSVWLFFEPSYSKIPKVVAAPQYAENNSCYVVWKTFQVLSVVKKCGLCNTATSPRGFSRSMG